MRNQTEPDPDVMAERYGAGVPVLGGWIGYRACAVAAGKSTWCRPGSVGDGRLPLHRTTDD
jgi:hypothetical protein